VSEQFLNGTSAQIRLFSASNDKLDRKLKPKGFRSKQNKLKRKMEYMDVIKR